MDDISIERRNELWEQAQVNGRTDDDLYGRLLDTEQARRLSAAAPHPAAMAIRNEVYDAALTELCDPDVLDDPNNANTLAMKIADRVLEYLSTKRVELPIREPNSQPTASA